MFKELESVPNFPEIEKEILKYWEEIDPVSILKNERKNSPEFVYYDGPITANGTAHYGHALTWTLKDIIPRYQSLKGNYVSRNLGWDCQGLPVEIEVEKKLGIKNKDEVENYGIGKFNEICKNTVLNTKDKIYEYEKRMGRFVDKDDEYYTMNSDFIESMWWSFKELFNKGLIYEDYKTIAYSPLAGTTLSSHEVKEGGYKDVEDHFIIAKFKLAEEGNQFPTYLLAYTTTPWTLYGNLLIGIKKGGSYSKVKVGEEYYVVSTELVPAIFTKPHQIIESFDAEKLVNRKYEPIFPHYQHKSSEGAFKVVYASHASTSEGTGLVHLAPYGEEDFNILFSLKIKSFDYLDDTAHFTSEIPELEGKFYKSANALIIENLKESNKCFSSGKVLHRMPMCYRTKVPLIYKPVKSWYLDVEKIKPRLLEEYQKVNYVPKHIKNGLAKVWYENVKNWCLSRNRFWGTPIPIWKNDETGELRVIGSFKELEDLSGVKLQDPHRPFVDEITFQEPGIPGTFRRIPDVLDVWYDSGSVPFAKTHYPFEVSIDGEKNQTFKKRFPAQYISEGSDQVHLWFYTMMVLSVALFDQMPYENAVVTGMILDKDASKLSKSKGNYPELEEVLQNYGADIFRFFILSTPLAECEATKFYEELLKDARKEFFIIYWNTVKFFTTYANIHNFEPEPNFKVDESKNVMDEWILARLKDLKIKVSNSLDNYYVMPATREIKPFLNELSTWYVRRSRDRIKDGDRDALNTLYYVLSEFTILISPFVPFISEKIYEILNLRTYRGKPSVHIEIMNFSDLSLSEQEKEILLKMSEDQLSISNALNLRTKAGISLRQPLLEIYSQNKIHFEEIYKDELNVKFISYDKKDYSKFEAVFDNSLILNLEITPELEEEKNVREFIRKIQDMRKNLGLKVEDKINVFYTSSDILKKTIEANLDLLTKKLNALSFYQDEVSDVESEKHKLRIEVVDKNKNS